VNDTPLTLLAVDDQTLNLRLLDAVLAPRGYRVVTASSGQEALVMLEDLDVDLVLLDVVMPGLDGYEVCRRIRARERTAYLPVVMITASGGQQRLAALEAGADDFVTKPFDQSELLARVASLTRLKRYHDTIERQANELASWNAELERRVKEGVAALDRTNRLRHFLSPQLADVVVDNQELLASHRREIVVVFCDFHGFTTFAETSEPEEVMEVLGSYHGAVGRRAHQHEATLERFTGDGIMLFFNDPVPCDDAAERAVRMALEIDADVQRLANGWLRRGHDLTHRSGIAQGFATLGRIGFPGRFDYAAIGSVTNLAARLCADAGDWEVRVTDRVLSELEGPVTSDLIGDIRPQGFSRTVRVHAVRSQSGRQATP
jgi:CheY-like chemotaxis protein